MHDTQRAAVDTPRCLNSCPCPLRLAVGLLTVFPMKEDSLLQNLLSP